MLKTHLPDIYYPYKLLFAALIPVLAASIQAMYWAELSPLIWILLYPAVFFSASLAGMPGGMLATAIATGIGIYWFIPPEASWQIENIRYVYSTSVFVLMGLAFSVTFARHHYTQAVLKNLNANLVSEQQGRLNTALQAADAGIWEWNPADNSNYWSENLWELYGLAAHSCEPSYASWLVTVHPDDKNRAEAAIREAVAENLELTLEWRLANLINGQERWLLSRGKPEFDAQGELRLYRGVVIDITQLKQTESVLRDKERLLTDSQAVARIGSWVQYLQSDEIVWSEQTFLIMGLTPNQRSSIPLVEFLALIHTDDKAIMVRWVEKCWAGEAPAALEFRVCISPSQECWMLGCGALERDDHGQPWRIIGTVQDITANKVLQAEKQRWADAFRYCMHGIAIGNPYTGLIETCNPAFAKLFGATQPEVMEGTAILALHTPERHEQIKANLEITDSLGQYSFESDYVRKDGTSLAIQVDLVSVRDPENRLLYRVATIQDISERKQQEAELLNYRDHLESLVAERTRELQEAREHAERLSGVKSSFLANMSHEIRTPMNAVLGFCYLLEQQALDLASRQLVDKIQVSGQSLLSIINDILDFSKIEAGRLEIENLPFRLLDLLDQLAALMSAAAHNQNLELLIIPPPSINPLIGDAMRLQQVLVNLLSNAIKFTESGFVELRISIVQQQGDEIQMRFAVRDSGIGISEEQQRDIFSAFTQADNTISRRFGGSGLGLAICQQLVKLMGGELQLVSEVDVGSEFWFVLPFQINPLQEWMELPLSNLQVLIVDDSAQAREALLFTAQSLGWQAEPVSNGEAAILKILEKELPYDVFLIDWRMPGLTGLSVAKIMHEIIKAEAGQAEKTPIMIMVTAYTLDELRAQSGIDIIDGVLSKPVTPSALYNAVANVFRSRQMQGWNSPSKSLPKPGEQIPGVRVLVVDDSEINREVAMRILETHGAIVSLANDGLQALKWLEKHAAAVDIILLDIQMPNMDGYTTVHIIRQNPKWAKLPVIALTAGAFSSFQQAALDAGMNDFIAKPFNVPAILAMIQRWTVSQSQITSESHLDSTGNLVYTDNKPLADPDLPAQQNLPDLPGIDLKVGLQTWGNLLHMQRYVQRFSIEYSHAGQQIADWIQQNNLDAARAFVHKLKGAAFGLALTKVAASCVAIETALQQNGLISDTGVALQLALDEVADSLALWLEMTAKFDAIESENFPEDAQIQDILQSLLVALDEDNPASAEPFVLLLENQLGINNMAAIKQQLLNFNFRQAKIQTQAMLDKYKNNMR